MRLFKTNKTRIAIFWERQADAANILKSTLTDHFASSVEIRTVADIAAEQPNYSEQSKLAIEQADGILMLARAEDFRRAGDFARELAEVQHQVKAGTRPECFYRFVAVNDDLLPPYYSTGLHPIRIKDLKRLSEDEKKELDEWFIAVRKYRPSPPPPIPSFDIEKIASEPMTRVALLRWLTKFETEGVKGPEEVTHLAHSIIANDFKNLKTLHSVHSTCGDALEAIADHLYKELNESQTPRRSPDHLQRCVTNAISFGITACGDRSTFYRYLQGFARELLPLTDIFETRIPSCIRYYDLARAGLEKWIEAPLPERPVDFVAAAQARNELYRTINQERFFLDERAQMIYHSESTTPFLARALNEARLFLTSIIECSEFIALLILVETKHRGTEQKDTSNLIATVLRASAATVRSKGAVFNIVKSANNLILLYISALAEENNVKAA